MPAGVAGGTLEQPRCRRVLVGAERAPPPRRASGSTPRRTGGGSGSTPLQPATPPWAGVEALQPSEFCGPPWSPAPAGVTIIGCGAKGSPASRWWSLRSRSPLSGSPRSAGARAASASSGARSPAPGLLPGLQHSQRALERGGGFTVPELDGRGRGAESEPESEARRGPAGPSATAVMWRRASCGRPQSSWSTARCSCSDQPSWLKWTSVCGATISQARSGSPCVMNASATLNRGSETSHWCSPHVSAAAKAGRAAFGRLGRRCPGHQQHVGHTHGDLDLAVGLRRVELDGSTFVDAGSGSFRVAREHLVPRPPRKGLLQTGASPAGAPRSPFGS